MKTIKSIFILALACIGVSCEKDTPIKPHEEELITTLRYTLTPEGGGDKIIFEYKDVDGNGSTPAEIKSGILKANTSYTGTLEFLNEIESPAKDITLEIKDEAEEHQVFYLTDPSLGTIFEYLDFDTNNQGLGLSAKVTTGTASTGKLRIILVHEPIKSGKDVTISNPTNAGGSIDFEANFDVIIE